MNAFPELIKSQLDFLQNWRNKLDELIQQLSYQEGDIRKDYFRMSYNNVKQYYISYTSYLTSYLINDSLLISQEGVDSRYGGHLLEVKALTKDIRDLNGCFYSMNHRVYIMAWSLFELAISTVFNHVCPDKKKEDYLNKKFKEIKNKVPKEHWEQVKKTLKIKSINLLPMPTKYGYLLKIAKGYDGNKQNELEFLTFFGKFRNTVHSNFIYFGEDFDYKFGQAHFVFRNGKIVKWTDPFSKHENIPTVELYTHLIGQLNDITLKIFSAVPYEGFIGYPDPDAE
ncbi:hypothetical protein [Sphingobacterium sp. GVS05A]|uniref:hypothetical protein n=1 Tax=Sphingobacterium sp. GVS05A TaxID=2862679 RepID=UPI001CBC0793|nr:hypothetical protein [Sphingobacterium sp. GVS05A]